jgi:hypothetical protein
MWEPRKRLHLARPFIEPTIANVRLPKMVENQPVSIVFTAEVVNERQLIGRDQ